MNNTLEKDLFLPIKIKTDLFMPYLSDKQMEAHYTGHYLKYCSNFNKFLQENSELRDIFFKLKKTNRTQLLLQIVNLFEPTNTIYQNVAQIYNHELFFYSLTNTDNSIRMLSKIKIKLFPTNKLFESFYTKFMDLGTKFFGSGWIFIILIDGKLDLITTPDAVIPINLNICACIDLWEHAYYLDYEYERKKYLTNVFMLINWNLIYKKIVKSN